MSRLSGSDAVGTPLPRPDERRPFMRIAPPPVSRGLSRGTRSEPVWSRPSSDPGHRQARPPGSFQRPPTPAHPRRTACPVRRGHRRRQPGLPAPEGLPRQQPAGVRARNGPGSRRVHPRWLDGRRRRRGHGRRPARADGRRLGCATRGSCRRRDRGRHGLRQPRPPSPLAGRPRQSDADLNGEDHRHGRLPEEGRRCPGCPYERCSRRHGQGGW